MNKIFSKPFKSVILLLSIAFLLSGAFSCRKPDLYPLGQAKIVGKIVDGVLTWDETLLPNKAAIHYVATDAYVLEYVAQKAEILRLRARVAELEAKK